ncbi:MAG: asparagine synthase C-terminal domain-containing protein [Alphaproteobacteria bacterium]
MARGLGDFVVARFEAPRTDWRHLAEGWRWPAIGGESPAVESAEIGEGLAAAWRGAVERTSGDGSFGLRLEQRLGETGIEEVIRGRPAGYRGKFAQAAVDPASGAITAHTDPMRQVPLYLLQAPGVTAVATDLSLLAQLPGWDRAILPEAIYHHLNFSYVPTPFTIYRAVQKLPPGAALRADRGGIAIERYWRPRYQEDLVPDGGAPDEGALAEELRGRLETVIGGHAADGADPACFLSGGTDSSTIASILSRTAGSANTHGFSIGFAEKAFDELDFAQAAAKSFGIDHHHRRITAEESMAAIDRLVDAFDEPFGNSSAIPTFYCADLARRQGHARLLGGDGGDEIFGGNERYAKDYYFQRYFDLPAPAKAVGGLVRGALKPIDLRFANRVKNFLNRGALANPERFYTDDSFASDFYDELLTADFRAACAKRSSLAVLERHFAEAEAGSDLNRLMYIDLQMAIADNDLTKVNRAAKAAGVSVLYPYLTPDLIEFMGRVPASLKVNRTAKRYLFKKAVAPLLPEMILTKKKQGFGLPFGHWFRHDPTFSAFVRDILLSRRSIERGYVEPAFLRRLIERHQQGVWDYRTEIWLLLMLELWHQHHADAATAERHAA